MRKFLTSLLVLFFFLGIFTIQGCQMQTETMVEPESVQILEVHFLDVGQGDCTMLLCGGDAMLIDAGGNDKGMMIQNYLQREGVETLKYMIATHPDADHIGGMDVILYKFPCETIIMTDEEKDTVTYRDVDDAMREKGYKKTLPVVGEKYPFGDAEFTIVGPENISGDSNNNSVAIVLTHGENTFLFTGDAEEEEELAMIESGISLSADVYKTGHHGSRTSSSLNLLNAAVPAYAVISCGEGNTYGHPHAETLNTLRAMGVKVFRTDEQGSVAAVSDGTTITWNCSPSESWQAGEPIGSSDNKKSASPTKEPDISVSAETSMEAAYICNINSKIFHYPFCPSIEGMSEENKMPSVSTREELIEQGYVPCKRCEP